MILNKGFFEDAQCSQEGLNVGCLSSWREGAAMCLRLLQPCVAAQELSWGVCTYISSNHIPCREMANHAWAHCFKSLESSSSAALPLLLLEEGAFQVGATSHSGGPKSQLTVVMATSPSEGVGAVGSKGCPSLLRNNAPGSLLGSLGRSISKNKTRVWRGEEHSVQLITEPCCNLRRMICSQSNDLYPY